MLFSTKALLIFLMSAFFDKNNTFTQSNSMRAVLEIFQFCFQFLEDKKVTVNKNVSFTDCVRNPASRWLQIGYELKKWQ